MSHGVGGRVAMGSYMSHSWVKCRSKINICPKNQFIILLIYVGCMVPVV